MDNSEANPGKEGSPCDFHSDQSCRAISFQDTRPTHTVAFTFLCIFRICCLSEGWTNAHTGDTQKAGEDGGIEQRVVDSQFDGFVPHNNVAWESEGLHVDDVDVSPLWADVQPFALEGQVAVCDSARDQDASAAGFSLAPDSVPSKSLSLITMVQLEGALNDWDLITKAWHCATLMKPDYL